MKAMGLSLGLRVTAASRTARPISAAMRFSCYGTGAADIAVSVHFVDVFGAEPNQVDPLAVIAGADARSMEAMQRGTRGCLSKGRASWDRLLLRSR